MSNTSVHPDDASLLRFSDGELPLRDAARVQQHLEACWECRTQLEDIQATIGDYIHYRRDTFQPELPPPPMPWMDIRNRFHATQPAPRRILFPYYLYAAAAAIVVCLLVYRFNNAPSVRAAELLDKAALAERHSPGKPRRLQIRTRSRTFVRLANQSKATQPDLEKMFADARFSWENPLSAESYAAWRRQLADKHDEISSTPESYEIRTSTGSGTLAEATIALRKQDLHPMRETLEFRDHQLVEISEMPDELVETPTAEHAPALQTRQPAASAVERTPLTPADELRVIAALHGIGADLGEPVEVRRNTDAIVVTGTGVNSERQKLIEESLAVLPNVQVHFVTPVASTPRVISTAGQQVAGGSPFESQLSERLGGTEAYSKFADRLLEQSDAMMARAHALRRLAERFPQDVEPQLAPGDRKILAALRSEHSDALAFEVREIGRSMKPVLSMWSVHGQAAVALAAAWQPATEQLWTAAQNADRLMGSLLAGSGGSAPASTPADLANAIVQLESLTNSYQALTKSTEH